jgi:hypothetical protein
MHVRSAGGRADRRGLVTGPLGQPRPRRRRAARRGRGARPAAVAVLLLALAGCGVPTDSAPRPLDKSDAPFRVFDPQTPAPPHGDLTAEVWFVRDERLVPHSRPIERPGTVRQVLETLFTGPTPAERAAGLATAIPASVVFRDVQVQDKIAVVSLDGLNEQVQVLAFAQIVATLSARPDVDGVRFRSAGADVQVPRGDGSLTDAPVNRSAYSSLLGGTPPGPVPPVPVTPTTSAPAGPA